jgi:hypothetical protein
MFFVGPDNEDVMDISGHLQLECTHSMGLVHRVRASGVQILSSAFHSKRSEQRQPGDISSLRFEGSSRLDPSSSRPPSQKSDVMLSTAAEWTRN